MEIFKRCVGSGEEKQRQAQINQPHFPSPPRAAAVVSRAEGDLLLHAVGTGDQDELSRECFVVVLAGAGERGERKQGTLTHSHTHTQSPAPCAPWAPPCATPWPGGAP